MAKKQTKQVQADLTVYAMREILMQYFKGTCVDNHAHNDLIQVRSEPMNSSGGRVRRYQRQQYELHQPKLLTLKRAPLLGLSKSPDTVVFYDQVLKRSPELQLLRKGLDSFFRRYLGGVKRQYDADSHADHARPSSDERALLAGTTFGNPYEQHLTFEQLLTTDLNIRRWSRESIEAVTRMHPATTVQMHPFGDMQFYSPDPGDTDIDELPF